MTTETSTGTGTSPSHRAGWRSDLFNYTRLSSTQLSHYHEQGYLVIKSLLSTEGRRTMVDECMRAWVSEKGPYDPNANWLSNALLANIHHQSQAVRDYYFNGPLVDIAEQIIGPNLKGVTSQLTFKMRGHTKGFAWHQDNGYGELDPYNAVTCLTALEDNDEQTGCLWVLPESHKLGQIRPGLTATQKLAGHEVVIHPDESKARPLPLEAGDCLIFSCWMLHKSEGNFSPDKDRRVLFLRYADANAVEVYNGRQARLGRLVRGHSAYPEVAAFEKDL